MARLHRRRRRRHRDGHPCRSCRCRARVRSSSTPQRPTTTPGPPVPAWPASRWSGDAARHCSAGWSPGLVWGVVARVFMRLLTDDPQFSWSGTLCDPRASRLSPGRAWAWCTGPRRRALAVVAPGGPARASLLFAGPGSLLVPAAVGMAMVLRGRPVVRALGALLVAVPPLVLVSGSPAPTPTQIAGLAAHGARPPRRSAGRCSRSSDGGAPGHVEERRGAATPVVGPA